MKLRARRERTRHTATQSQLARIANDAEAALARPPPRGTHARNATRSQHTNVMLVTLAVFHSDRSALKAAAPLNMDLHFRVGRQRGKNRYFGFWSVMGQKKSALSKNKTHRMEVTRLVFQSWMPP